MTEIILSFFAVIGITLLALHICDYFFFRKFQPILSLIVDLRDKSEIEAIEILELIASVRQNQSGKAALGDLIVIVKSGSEEVRKIANHYMQTFHMTGTIYDEKNPAWKERF